MGGDYTFLWKARWKKSTNGVGFTIKNKLVDQLEDSPCRISKSLMTLRFTLGWKHVCENGNLKCTGQDPQEHCYPPKVYFNCANAQDGEYGAACAQTCQMLAAEGQCLTTKCVSGCVCPDGLVLDEGKGCVHPDNCSCEYGGHSYGQDDVIVKDCMKCFCSRGKWNCHRNAMCPSTCMVHGEGHISTFDGKQYVFDGNCEYILVQDACSAIYTQPSFKIVAENVICSRSKTVCTKTIKVYFEDFLIKMTDGTYKVIPENATSKFTVVHNQMYLIFYFGNFESLQLIVTWNLRMNTYIQIAGSSQLSVCGLCGNANGNIKDELITQSHHTAFTLMNFVNSWKEDPMCDDVTEVIYPCAKNPYRKSWAEKRCKIIQSVVFEPCHNLLQWRPYYDKCIRDACGCELIGDCDCLCDAVAAFAKTCLDAGVCIDWRTPDFCPVNCDFYNTHDRRTNTYKFAGDIECKWHYQPCLCPNIPWIFSKTNMEGCYNCSIDEYYDASQQRCVPCTSTVTTSTTAPTSKTRSTATTIPSTSTTAWTATASTTAPTSTMTSSTASTIPAPTTTLTSTTAWAATASTTALTTTTSTTEELPVGGTVGSKQFFIYFNPIINSDCINNSMDSDCINNSINSDCINNSNNNTSNFNNSINNNSTNNNLDLNNSMDSDCINSSIHSDCINNSIDSDCINNRNILDVYSGRDTYFMLVRTLIESNVTEGGTVTRRKPLPGLDGLRFRDSVSNHEGTTILMKQLDQDVEEAGNN
ncbi:mucin-6-like [Chiloscyllium plagiosum]|uniref:mucin-6-like n=1 Tax=Chiloscyllium plagiosum TaxID=36176 RepID=UPI001CB8230C|nr:mucin-6-like [Chiloscyllium plagiosum]